MARVATVKHKTARLVILLAMVAGVFFGVTALHDNFAAHADVPTTCTSGADTLSAAGASVLKCRWGGIDYSVDRNDVFTISPDPSPQAAAVCADSTQTKTSTAATSQSSLLGTVSLTNSGSAPGTTGNTNTYTYTTYQVARTLVTTVVDTFRPCKVGEIPDNYGITNTNLPYQVPGKLTFYPWSQQTSSTFNLLSQGTIIAPPNMGWLFYSTYSNTAFTSSGLSNWDTSHVWNLGSLFMGYSAGSPSLFTGAGLMNWQTGNVIDMSYMFAGASPVSTFYLQNWDTSHVVRMNSMFANNSWPLSSQPLSSWKLSNVVDMSNMFYDSGIDSTTGLSGWNTSNVVNMSNMFTLVGITPTAKASFSTTGLTTWDTGNVSNMGSMFSGINACTNFSLDGLKSWDVSHVTEMSYMFSNDYSDPLFTTAPLSAWNTSSVKNMQGMYSNDQDDVSFTADGLTKWNTSSLTQISQMFYADSRDPAFTSLMLGNWNLKKVSGSYLNTAFSGVGTLTQVQFPPTLNDQTNVSGLYSQTAQGYPVTWQAVGTGTPTAPNGPVMGTTAQLMASYNGTSNPTDIMVIQPQTAPKMTATASDISASSLPASLPSGSAFKFFDSLTCASSSPCQVTSLTIPFSASSDGIKGATPSNSWKYASGTNTTTGLLASTNPVVYSGKAITVTFAKAIPANTSVSLEFDVTPPNGTTPNGTKLTLGNQSLGVFGASPITILASFTDTVSAASGIQNGSTGGQVSYSSASLNLAKNLATQPTTGQLDCTPGTIGYSYSLPSGLTDTSGFKGTVPALPAGTTAQAVSFDFSPIPKTGTVFSIPTVLTCTPIGASTPVTVSKTVPVTYNKRNFVSSKGSNSANQATSVSGNTYTYYLGSSSDLSQLANNWTLSNTASDFNGDAYQTNVTDILPCLDGVDTSAAITIKSPTVAQSSSIGAPVADPSAAKCAQPAETVTSITGLPLAAATTVYYTDGYSDAVTNVSTYTPLSGHGLVYAITGSNSGVKADYSPTIYSTVNKSIRVGSSITNVESYSEAETTAGDTYMFGPGTTSATHLYKRWNYASQINFGSYSGGNKYINSMTNLSSITTNDPSGLEETYVIADSLLPYIDQSTFPAGTAVIGNYQGSGNTYLQFPTAGTSNSYVPSFKQTLPEGSWGPVTQCIGVPNAAAYPNGSTTTDTASTDNTFASNNSSLWPTIDTKNTLLGNRGTETMTCQYWASYTTYGVAPGYQFTKYAQGDLDSVPHTAPYAASVSKDGSGSMTYTVKVLNPSSQANLTSTVVYDNLPFNGDSLGSTYTPAFTGLSLSGSGTSFAAANWTVYYSQSRTPCEAVPGDSTWTPPSWESTCTDDWSSSLPADPSTVTAIKLAANAQAYVPTSGGYVQLAIAMKVPVIKPTDTAYNSAKLSTQGTVSGANTPLASGDTPKIGAGYLLPGVAVTDSAGLVTNNAGTYSTAFTVRAFNTTPNVPETITLADTAGNSLTGCVLGSDGKTPVDPAKGLVVNPGDSVTCSVTHTFTAAELASGVTLNDAVTATAVDTNANTVSAQASASQGYAPISYQVCDYGVAGTPQTSCGGSPTFLTPQTLLDLVLVGKTPPSADTNAISSLIQSYTAKGYAVSSKSTNLPSINGPANSLPVPSAIAGYTVSVALTHSTVTNVVGNPPNTVKQTVHYQTADGSKPPTGTLSPDNVQTFNFTSTTSTVIDQVTGLVVGSPTTTYNPTTQTSVAVATPIVPGYKPSTTLVPATAYAGSSPDTTITVVYTPFNLNFSVVKSATVNGYDVGDTVTYSIAVTNTGNLPFTWGAATDQMSDGATDVVFNSCALDGQGSASAPTTSTSIPVGRTLTCTGTHSLTQADVDAKTISNTATVTGTICSPDSLTDPAGSACSADPSSATYPVDWLTVQSNTVTVNLSSYLITFDPNKPGATSSSLAGAMQAQRVGVGAGAALKPNQFALSAGYTFAGWSTCPTPTSGNPACKSYPDKYAIPADSSGASEIWNPTTLAPASGGQSVTLYAQWTPWTYKVSFARGRGTTTANTVQWTQTLTYDQPTALTSLANLNTASFNSAGKTNQFNESGYSFAGWCDAGLGANAGTGAFYCSAGGSATSDGHNFADGQSVTQASFAQPVSANGQTLALYAVWSLNPMTITAPTRVNALVGSSQTITAAAPQVSDPAGHVTSYPSAYTPPISAFPEASGSQRLSSAWKVAVSDSQGQSKDLSSIDDVPGTYTATYTYDYEDYYTSVCQSNAPPSCPGTIGVAATPGSGVPTATNTNVVSLTQTIIVSPRPNFAINQPTFDPMAVHTQSADISMPSADLQTSGVGAGICGVNITVSYHDANGQTVPVAVTDADGHTQAAGTPVTNCASESSAPDSSKPITFTPVWAAHRPGTTYTVTYTYSYPDPSAAGGISTISTTAPIEVDDYTAVTAVPSQQLSPSAAENYEPYTGISYATSWSDQHVTDFSSFNSAPTGVKIWPTTATTTTEGAVDCLVPSPSAQTVYDSADPAQAGGTVSLPSSTSGDTYYYETYTVLDSQSNPVQSSSCIRVSQDLMSLRLVDTVMYAGQTWTPADSFIDSTDDVGDLQDWSQTSPNLHISVDGEPVADNSDCYTTIAPSLPTNPSFSPACAADAAHTVNWGNTPGVHTISFTMTMPDGTAMPSQTTHVYVQPIPVGKDVTLYGPQPYSPKMSIEGITSLYNIDEASHSINPSPDVTQVMNSDGSEVHVNGNPTGHIRETITACTSADLAAGRPDNGQSCTGAAAFNGVAYDGIASTGHYAGYFDPATTPLDTGTYSVTFTITTGWENGTAQWARPSDPASTWQYNPCDFDDTKTAAVCSLNNQDITSVPVSLSVRGDLTSVTASTAATTTLTAAAATAYSPADNFQTATNFDGTSGNPEQTDADGTVLIPANPPIANTNGTSMVLPALTAPLPSMAFIHTCTDSDARAIADGTVFSNVGASKATVTCTTGSDTAVVKMPAALKVNPGALAPQVDQSAKTSPGYFMETYYVLNYQGVEAFSAWTDPNSANNASTTLKLYDFMSAKLDTAADIAANVCANEPGAAYSPSSCLFARSSSILLTVLPDPTAISSHATSTGASGYNDANGNYYYTPIDDVTGLTQKDCSAAAIPAGLLNDAASDNGSAVSPCGQVSNQSVTPTYPVQVGITPAAGADSSVAVSWPVNAQTVNGLTDAVKPTDSTKPVVPTLTKGSYSETYYGLTAAGAAGYAKWKTADLSGTDLSVAAYLADSSTHGFVSGGGCSQDSAVPGCSQVDWSSLPSSLTTVPNPVMTVSSTTDLSISPLTPCGPGSTDGNCQPVPPTSCGVNSDSALCIDFASDFDFGSHTTGSYNCLPNTNGGACSDTDPSTGNGGLSCLPDLGCDQTYYSTTQLMSDGSHGPNFVEVNDRRANTLHPLTGWTLNVSSTPFTYLGTDLPSATNGYSLPQVFMHLANPSTACLAPGISTPTASSSDLTVPNDGNQVTVMAAATGAGQGVCQDRFGTADSAGKTGTAGHSVYLSVPSGTTQLSGKYSSTLTWTLEDTPLN